MAVGHLLLLDGYGVAEVVAEVEPAVALVPVVEQEVARKRRPAVAEDDLLALDVLHDLHGRAGGRSGLHGIRAPAVGVEEHGPEPGARRLGEVDELGRDRLGRPLAAGVAQRRRGGLEKDEEVVPVGRPVGVAEVGDHPGGTHQVHVIAGVVIHLRRREHRGDPVEGVGVAEQGIEPDPVVDGGILDLPVAPVVVAEGPSLHLPAGAVGVLGQGPHGPGQRLGPERRAVHGAPFRGPQKVAHAPGDEVRGLVLFGGGETAEAAEGVVGPDVAHGREEIRQGRDAAPRVVGPESDRRFGVGGPVVAVGQEDLLGPGGVFRLFLPFVEIGVDDGHFQETARGPVAEDVEGIERLLPLGDELVPVGIGPVGGRPGVRQVPCPGSGREGRRQERDDQGQDRDPDGQRAGPAELDISHVLPPLGSPDFSITVARPTPTPPAAPGGSLLRPRSAL